MRDTYHEALDGVTDQIVIMVRTVGSMIDRASAALLEVDLSKAESVIAQDEDVDLLTLELEERATSLGTSPRSPGCATPRAPYLSSSGRSSSRWPPRRR